MNTVEPQHHVVCRIAYARTRGYLRPPEQAYPAIGGSDQQHVDLPAQSHSFHLDLNFVNQFQTLVIELNMGALFYQYYDSPLVIHFHCLAAEIAIHIPYIPCFLHNCAHGPQVGEVLQCGIERGIA